MTIFLIAYLVVFFGIAIGLRTFLVWRRTGINPVRFERDDEVQRYIGKLLVVVFLLIGVAVADVAFGGIFAGFIPPVIALQASAIQYFGVGLLVLALLVVSVAQARMGDSWRIGIDSEHETALVTGGLFRVSRNPIFLGMQVALVGLFLCVPNLLTALCLALGHVLIQIQVRSEESHLAALHGERYAAYRSRVRRWL